MKRFKIEVLHTVNNTTVVDRFKGRHISTQMFGGGRAKVVVDDLVVQYSHAEKIIVKRRRRRG